MESGYAPVNGLEMYYEIHGSGPPVVLLHGSFSGIGTSFGAVAPLLADRRQVIGVEFQGHARTADIDRPIRVATLASDVDQLLAHLKIEQADLFGYSLGAGVALDTAIRYPARVRKLVLASLAVTLDGLHPGFEGGMDALQPEWLHGSVFHDEYLETAPRPGDFPQLVDRIKDFSRDVPVWPAETIQALAAPVLLVVGDSDIVRPEHAVETFRLLGGGVNGDLAGLPRSRLAVLPGTTHTGVAAHGSWLAPMIDDFLDAPV